MIGSDDPALEPVWRQLSDRWSTAGDRAVRSIDLRPFNHRTRTAIADLLGLDRVPPGAGRLAVDRLMTGLDLDTAGLRAMIEAAVGPIGDAAGSRAADVAARSELWNWFEAACAKRGMSAWFHQQRSAGIPGGDVVGLRGELSSVLALVDTLPADGIALAVVAMRHFGDPHALDRDRRLANVVMRALSAAAGQEPADTAEDIRRLWARFGVTVDELSSNVLLLGLRVVDGHPLHHYLAGAADRSEPVLLTLDQIQRHGLHPATPTAVRVVENPSIVAEASRRRAGGVFVCSSGWPSLAAVSALADLAVHDCRLYVHADFDGDGIGIVRHLRDRVGAFPWAMSADVYLAAVRAAGPTIDEATPADVVWSVPATPWDPGLQKAMMMERRAVYEEQLVDQLLAVHVGEGRT